MLQTLLVRKPVPPGVGRVDVFGKFKTFDEGGKRCLRVVAEDLEGSTITELVEEAEKEGFDRISIGPELESRFFPTPTVFLRPEPVCDKLEIAVEERGGF